MATWRKLSEKEFKENKEDISKMKTTLTEDELDEEFDNGYGGDAKILYKDNYERAEVSICNTCVYYSSTGEKCNCCIHI